MAHSWHHAVSSARQFGGEPEDYVEIHSWFDASKVHMADFRHRALRHHTEGIFEAERLFGTTIVNSRGQKVPVRLVGEQHMMEDFGRIPSLVDWLECVEYRPWMTKAAKLSKVLALSETLTTSPGRAKQ